MRFRRLLVYLRNVVRTVVESLGLGDELIRCVRGLSTIGVVFGLTVVVSAFIFPTLPVRFFTETLWDFSSTSTLFSIDEWTFSVILGVGFVITGTGLHFALDLYLRTVGIPWKFSGKGYLQFLTLVSFVIAFVTARTLVVLSGIVGPTTGGKAGWIPIHELWISGYHVHHFFLGFLALAAVGWRTIFHDGYSRRTMAVLYGGGLGILVDEVGMLLTEGDYFANSTYFVAGLFVALLLTGICWDRLSEDQQEPVPPSSLDLENGVQHSPVYGESYHEVERFQNF